MASTLSPAHSLARSRSTANLRWWTGLLPWSPLVRELTLTRSGPWGGAGRLWEDAARKRLSAPIDDRLTRVLIDLNLSIQSTYLKKNSAYFPK